MSRCQGKDAVGGGRIPSPTSSPGRSRSTAGSAGHTRLSVASALPACGVRAACSSLRGVTEVGTVTPNRGTGPPSRLPGPPGRSITRPVIQIDSKLPPRGQGEALGMSLVLSASPTAAISAPKRLLIFDHFSRAPPVTRDPISCNQVGHPHDKYP